MHMIFIASVEVEPLPGSKMTDSGIGGVVYCFIPAASKRAAKQRLLAALSSDNYRLIKTEFLDEYRNFSWERVEDQAEYDKLAKKAAANHDVVYGPFYTWQTR